MQRSHANIRGYFRIGYVGNPSIRHRTDTQSEQSDSESPIALSQNYWVVFSLRSTRCIDGVRLQPIYRSLPQATHSRSPQTQRPSNLSQTTKARFCVTKNVPVLRSDHAPFETFVFGMRSVAQRSSAAEERYTRMIATLFWRSMKERNRATLSA